MTVSQRLKEFIEKNRMKVPDVATATGIDGAKIHKWIQGKANPKYEDTRKLELFLNGEKVPNVSETAIAYETTDASVTPAYSDRYIKLLEETVKETKAQRTELQARLDELTGRQADFLARVESLIERYEHLVLAQLQSKGQEVPDSTPTVLQQTYKKQGIGQKKNS
jgi:transcriptional regulator with XRE-family HTH domain